MLTIGGLPVQAANEHFSISRVSYMYFTQHPKRPSIISHQRACVLVCEKVQNIYVDVQKCRSVPRSTAIGDAQYRSLVVRPVLARESVQQEVVSTTHNVCSVRLEAGVVLHFARSALLHMPLASDSLDALDDAGTRPLPPPPPP